MEKEINIIENVIEAISILNKTDDYLEGLNDKLSECDLVTSDLEHIIENNDLRNINLTVLFNEFQSNLLKRRKIKNNLALNIYLKNNRQKLQEKTNREFLIQGLKKIEEQTGDSKNYKNRKITDDTMEKINTVNTKKKVGRPKKEIKEGE